MKIYCKDSLVNWFAHSDKKFVTRSIAKNGPVYDCLHAKAVFGMNLRRNLNGQLS